MEISLSSFMATAVSITILIGILILLKKHMLSGIGILTIYLFSILILIRGMLPFDFNKIHLTTNILSTHILPYVRDLVITELFKIGSITLTPLFFMMSLWIIGSIISLIKMFALYINTRKILEAFPYVNSDMDSAFLKACRKVFPNKEIKCRLLRVNMFDTPAVFGFFDPIIILPTIEYNDQERYAIYEHELMHIKHKDFIVNILGQMLIALYWWNPLIKYCLIPSISSLQEYSVDNSIQKYSSDKDRAIYVETIYKTVASSIRKNNSKNSVYTFVDVHAKDDIVQRIQLFMGKKRKTFSLIGTLAVILLYLLSYSFVFEPYYKPEQDENGNHMYYFVSDNSYYIVNGEQYDLYLDGEFAGTYPSFFQEFKDLPIYTR